MEGQTHAPHGLPEVGGRRAQSICALSLKVQAGPAFDPLKIEKGVSDSGCKSTISG